MTIVQSAVSTVQTTTVSETVNGTVAGNTLVVMVWGTENGASAPTASGLTFHAVTFNAPSQILYYAYNIPGGNVTVTTTIGSGGVCCCIPGTGAMFVYELAAPVGGGGSDPLDQHNTGSSSASPSSPITFSTSSGLATINEVVLAFIYAGTVTTWGVGTGYGSFHADAHGSSAGEGAQATSTSTQTAGFTFTTSPGASPFIIATFKSAPAAAAPTGANYAIGRSVRMSRRIW